VTAASQGPVARHLLPLTSSISDSGSLSIGGVELTDIAEAYGTPVFVYDEDHLRHRCREAVSAFGGGVAYASKAFLCRAMAALAAEEGMAIDVSTGGELHVALSAGVAADRLVLHGNNKSEVELVAAVKAGVGRIVVDSFDEVDRLGRMSGLRIDVLVRVTPGIEAHTHEYVRTGQDDSKFGFGLASGAAAEAVARLQSTPGVEVVGLHAHIGSQIFLLDPFVAEVQALVPLLETYGLRELCVGGGLGVAYVEGEHAPTLAQWANAVHTAVGASGLPAGVRVSVEPGRSIVADAAVTLYRVGTIKQLPGIRTYVSVDGGMSDNPRPVLYGSGYEAFLPRCTAAARPLTATIVGKHCESGDVIVRDAQLPADLAVGDLLATPVTGAYGHSMASNYNKVPRPPVLFVSGGTARVVVRRETHDDLTRLDC